MNTPRRNGRIATYATLAALALALGVAGPAQADTNVVIGGDSTIRVTATAKTGDRSLKIKERLHARASVAYKAYVAGIPLPLTAKYYNSIPVHFSTPRLDDVDNADLDSRKYRVLYDPWLKTDQWLVSGDKGFWGELKVSIKGSALAKKKGAKYFHAGSGVGHAVDANSALRITVK